MAVRTLSDYTFAELEALQRYLSVGLNKGITPRTVTFEIQGGLHVYVFWEDSWGSPNVFTLSTYQLFDVPASQVIDDLVREILQADHILKRTRTNV